MDKAAQPAAVDRERLFRSVRRVVVKLGTRVVTVRDNALNRKVIDRLAEDVAELHGRGIRVAVVTSGAVGAGMGQLGLKLRPRRIPDLQATAAVGQGLLMHAYKLAFQRHGLAIGQVLLTAEDLDDRRRYVNAHNTLNVLFRFGVVPVINENDSVAVDEIKVGDNDRLSAQVAHLVDANLLVLLTDVDGLYSDNPSRNRDARLIPVVDRITPDLAARAGEAGSAVSLGGMRTKLHAAESVTQGGRMMVVANGHRVRISEILSGTESGTLFCAGARPLHGRKIWIANGRKRGSVVVDDGAVAAIGRRGKSLLPSGVVQVVGDFEAGELIGIEDRSRQEVARGLVRYGSEEIRRILGKKTSEVAAILKGNAGTEVVHRDDLVVLER